MPEIPNINFYYSFQPLDIFRGAYRIPLNKPLFEGVAYWKVKFIGRWTRQRVISTTVLVFTVLN